MADLLTPTYEVNLYIDGTLIGDVRKLAQDLKWVRRRTRMGADEIDFSLNDVLFAAWCEARGTDIGTMLRPMALECRVVRNGVAVMGGFLATMPGYSPNGTSATLDLKFDGYLNLLAGVYITPIGTVRARMNVLIQRFIAEADTRASNAGKAFGFTAGSLQALATVEHTFDNYKSTKEWITDRCDNVSGAGEFDLYFHPDKTYDLRASSSFGDKITDWAAHYPAMLNNVSAATIAADEIAGFASTVIGIGAGEVSSNAAQNTAITSTQTNGSAVVKYGYAEELIQESSVSKQATLNANVATELKKTTTIVWTPKITLLGRQVAPTPTGSRKIWIGDTITVDNTEDPLGQTSGQFRVNELEVAVSATGAETITPTLERV